MAEANPITAFVGEYCTRNPQGKCLLKEFYEDYRRWAQERGYTRTQQYRTVKRNLENLGFPMKEQQGRRHLRADAGNIWAVVISRVLRRL